MSYEKTSASARNPRNSATASQSLYPLYLFQSRIVIAGVHSEAIDSDHPRSCRMAGEERLDFFVDLEESSIKGSFGSNESTDFPLQQFVGFLNLAVISDHLRPHRAPLHDQGE
jgi:hypothetical protein